MRSLETVFLAVASKNGFITHDEAAACLNEFQSQPAAGPRRTIEEIVQEGGLLTSEQVRVIGAAATKVMPQESAAGPETSPPPAGSPSGAAPEAGKSAAAGSAGSG